MTGLNSALPLNRGIDSQICFLLTKFMQNDHPWMKQIFGDAIYTYLKIDLASIQRPSCFVYPKRSGKDSYANREGGIITMELHFSLQQQRADLVSNVVQIVNDIKLINLNQEFTNYMANDMPKLFQFGKKLQVDYTKLSAKECLIKIDFDYWVDLISYQVWLQDMGCDITSPDQQIYPPALALREAIAVMNNPNDVAFVTGTTKGELVVKTPTEEVNLAINPEDNSQVLAVNTF